MVFSLRIASNRRQELSEQPGRPTLLKVSVISKCANPSCSTPFRYLRGGRLFCFASASGTEPWTYGMPYRWLCSECSPTMTLNLDEHGRVALLLVAG